MFLNTEHLDLWLVWLILAIVLLVLEMVSMSLYLLVCAIAFAVSAIFAYAGFGAYVQVLIAGVLIVLGLYLINIYRKKQIQLNINDPSKQMTHIDTGAQVQVEAWIGQQARVYYRGSFWQAHSIDQTPEAGQHTIVDIQKNVLHLSKNSKNSK